MRISDDERREIANGLRRLADGRHDTGVPDSEIMDVLGISPADTPNRSDARDVEILADLIYRPTCRNVSGYQDTFKCSECGYKTGLIAEVCNEHGESFHMPLMPSRCPNCEAEVVE